jgi:hypothetical protein
MITAALSGAVARASEPAPLNELLPQDTLGFVEMAPSPQDGKGLAGSPLIDMGLQAMQSAGVMKEESGLVADVLGLAGEVNSGRSCVAWLDADLSAPPAAAAPGGGAGAGGGLECKSVQLVWIIETDRPADMVERLTRLLSHLSTQATARQSVKHTAEHHKEYVEFHDTRWPDWLTLGWAQETDDSATSRPGTEITDTREAAETTQAAQVPVGNGRARFVLALGEGAMEHYLADRPVGDVPWLQMIQSMDSHDAAESTFTRIFVNTKLLRERFPDAVQRTVLGRLLTSLNLSDSDGCLFVARRKDRVISLASAVATSGKMTPTPWTVALPSSAPLLKAVPDEATAYVVLKVDWPQVYHRVMAVADTLKNDSGNESLEAYVARLAQQRGVDVRKDILDRLQPLVLVHDVPQHPLHLPLMVTVLSAAEPGSEDKVKSALGKLTDAVAARLDAKASGGTPVESDPAVTPAPKLSSLRVRLRTDTDGIRYLQLGLVGPAWGWVENRLVFSWSPGAVRANVTAAGRVTSSAFDLSGAP